MVLPALEAALGQPVAFAADCVGPVAAAAVASLPAGGVLLLENTRFHKGEEANDPEFAAGLAALGDVYCNDAFSAAHRAHASTEGIARLLPSCAGRLMQAELEALERALGRRRSGRWWRWWAGPRSRASSSSSATWWRGSTRW